MNIHNVQLAVGSLRDNNWISMRSLQFCWPFFTKFGISLSFLATRFEEDDILLVFKGKQLKNKRTGPAQ